VSRPSDPFKRARSPETSTSTIDETKGTTWSIEDVPDTDGAGPMTETLSDFNRLAIEAKGLKTRLADVQERLETYAGQRWVECWAEHGIQPDVPVRLANPDTGEYATYVVNDKTASVYVTEKLSNALGNVLGPEVVTSALVETILYSFNQALLARTVKSPESGRKRTIQRLVADRIGPLLDALVTSEELTREEADSLLTATTVNVFDRDFVPSLPALCKNDPDVLSSALGALGGTFVRYVKPS
jgi:hypothetical protein